MPARIVTTLTQVLRRHVRPWLGRIGFGGDLLPWFYRRPPVDDSPDELRPKYWHPRLTAGAFGGDFLGWLRHRPIEDLSPADELASRRWFAGLSAAPIVETLAWSRHQSLEAADQTPDPKRQSWPWLPTPAAPVVDNLAWLRRRPAFQEEIDELRRNPFPAWISPQPAPPPAVPGASIPPPFPGPPRWSQLVETDDQRRSRERREREQDDEEALLVILTTLEL